MGKKSDNTELAARVDAVLRILLDGAQHHDVVAYAAAQKWDVSERQVRTYIARADALLVERREKSRKRLITRHIARRESLFARAINAADFRTALAVLSDLAKLQGLYVDDRDLRELVTLAREQGTRLADMEKRLTDAATRQAPRDTGGSAPSDGRVGDDDAGGTGGATGELPP